MEEYKHIISLGHFCSVATELEKEGYREASLPFDWLITPFDSLLYMIENNFDSFLDLENLEKDEPYKYIVKNRKHDIAFYHDFKANKTIEEELEEVKIKYKRRIDRFYSFIEEKTLFIRYIENIDEYKYIEDNYERIISLLKSFNPANDLMLISKDIKQREIPLHTIYCGKAPIKTPQVFLKYNTDLFDTFNNFPYPKDKRQANLRRYKGQKWTRLKNKIKKTYNKVIYR